MASGQFTPTRGLGLLEVLYMLRKVRRRRKVFEVPKKPQRVPCHRPGFPNVGKVLASG